MIKKRLLILIGVIAVIVMGVSFLIPTPSLIHPLSQGRPVVFVSTFSLLESARLIAGETLDVRGIIPLGSDPHLFSPSPSLVADIAHSSLFIYNGSGYEPWAEPLKNTFSSSIRVVNMSQHVVLLGNDPHYWLDIDNMIRMGTALEAEFIKLSPSNAAQYHINAKTYRSKLEALKVQYVSGLSDCKNRLLVSNHDAFGYLARANKLEDLSVIGLSSDEQPSPKNIADIIKVVRERGIKTIFFEEFINDNVSQMIAKETGTKVQSLQPLETISEDELKSHQTYLSIMQGNLTKLRNAMECR